MQRTNNYGLCQYEGSDKTSYLVNYNDDMLKIDTAIKGASDAASSAQTKADTADGKADTNAGNISTLNTQINGASGLAADVSTLQGAVNTINSLIGNGEPTTTDKTLIGAINEINGNESDLSGTVSALSGTVTDISTDVSGMKANKLGNVVDLTQYPLDASQGFYTAPSDGYIKLLCASNITAELAVHIYGSDATGTSDEHLIEDIHNVNNIDMYSTVFIRKGMKLLGFSSASGTLVGFVPLTT